MDALSFAINESQWMLCLIQVTGLMLIGWLIGQVTLRKYPDISASIGVVVLAASAGLVVITLAGAPRPFELTTPPEVTQVVTHLNSNLPNTDVSNPDARPIASSGLWLNRLASFINFSSTPVSGTDITAATRPLITAERSIGLLILLTLLGGSVGIFRVAHASRTIRALVRSSSPIRDEHICSEVARIVAQLPTTLRHQGISIHQINGLGSPFVSWLTGSKIFVPETFLDWTASEQSTGLAHEISHLQRRDHFCRLLIQLACYLNWLHPLAWILHRQTVLAQELAADQLAAQTIENPLAYCRGLSRLALRFDAECRHPPALGVSVSSSLIRRITMLREITFHRLPCSRLVHRCITLSTFITCTWIACWSVEGQTTTQEKVDSKVVAASHSVPVKMFSQPMTKPWDSLGNQSGYSQIQLNRLLEHPDLKAYIPLVTAAFDRGLFKEHNTTPTLKKFGLSLDNIAQINGAFWMSIQNDPNRPNGHRNVVTFAPTAAEITTVDKVDWPRLIKALDLQTLVGSVLPDDYFDKLRLAWLNSATKSRSIVFPTVAVDGTAVKNQPPLTESKKALWQAVSGGIATVVYDIRRSGEYPKVRDIIQSGEAAKVDSEEDKIAAKLIGNDVADEWEQANREMTFATETAAWGFDLSQDYNTCRIRFAATPNPEVSIDELLNKFDAFRDAMHDQLAPAAKNVDNKRMGDNGLEKHLWEQWNKIKVSVVPSKEVNGEKAKPYILVEGECSGTLIKAYAMGLPGMFALKDALTE